jgi:squalene cyclase
MTEQATLTPSPGWVEGRDGKHEFRFVDRKIALTIKKSQYQLNGKPLWDCCFVVWYTPVMYWYGDYATLEIAKAESFNRAKAELTALSSQVAQAMTVVETLGRILGS